MGTLNSQKVWGCRKDVSVVLSLAPRPLLMMVKTNECGLIFSCSITDLDLEKKWTLFSPLFFFFLGCVSLKCLQS